jgi:hypothetical protein
MYVIQKDSNTLQPLRQCTFGELGFRERQHLQEWVASASDFIGEELLIIQKEFAGFSDTTERLDLLALDRDGNLVIIENKLDDSGRDVTWQALKYASYCSSLSKDQIRTIYQRYLDATSAGTSAEAQLSEFFGGAEYEELELNTGVSQRVILIAANYRKEVTSTVLWLLNYGLRVQCFRVTPFELGDRLVLNVEQIIPMKEAAEYIISMGTKAQENVTIRAEKAARYGIRKEFWTQVLDALRGRTELFSNVSPGEFAWISTGAGVGSVTYALVATRQLTRAEIYIQKTRAESSRFFDLLFRDREAIETDFGAALVWEREVGERGARIKSEMEANLYDREQWPAMTEFLVDRLIRLERATRQRIMLAGRKLKSAGSSAVGNTVAG